MVVMVDHRSMKRFHGRHDPCAIGNPGEDPQGKRVAPGQGYQSEVFIDDLGIIPPLTRIVIPAMQDLGIIWYQVGEGFRHGR
jgi:hypothetical protein